MFDRHGKHSGISDALTTTGISKGFKQSERYKPGEAVRQRGSQTKAYPWKVRARRRRANKIASASRKANRR